MPLQAHEVPSPGHEVLLPEAEPPTEPFLPIGDAAPLPPPAAGPPPPNPFSRDRYHFTSGLPFGETARIVGDDGAVLLTYRSFASIVGTVAALVAGVVIVAGVAGTLFLVAEGRPLAAVSTFVLSILFTALVAMLVPRTNVALYDGSHPALTIAQRSRFIHLVATPDGRPLALLRKSPFSRFGRNRWTILTPSDGREIGSAVEDSFAGALLRKLFGKFSRSFQTDLLLTYEARDAGRIHRRKADVLDLGTSAMDRRVAVALATLILGSEP
ncbi:MAG: hypothetical protein JOZ54_16095 [Acidobacteria bacterium]|nr:hypothetical protein [Acidobacteriota bacterium]